MTEIMGPQCVTRADTYQLDNVSSRTGVHYHNLIKKIILLVKLMLHEPLRRQHGERRDFGSNKALESQ